MKLYRPNWIEINSNAISENITAIRQYIKKHAAAAKKSVPEILAVIKTNAYGHGMIPVAKTLYSKNIRFFGVMGIDEGIQLRLKLGSKIKILILGSLYPFNEAIPAAIRYNLIPTISSNDGILYLDKLSKKYRKQTGFHLKIDTGMARIGISPAGIPGFIEKLADCANVKLDGVYTHFSSADSNPDYTRQQIDLFNSCITKLKNISGLYTPVIHAANSAGLINYPDSFYDMVRPGLSLYGLYPSLESVSKIKLSPVLSWKTRVIFLKKTGPGKCVSYGCTYKTKRNTVIATVPVGYGDGYYRHLSNKGYMLINGKKAGIIGRVTMDMAMLDVTDIPETNTGTEVVIIGKSGKNTITVEELASLAWTNNYEIVCNLHTRVPRIYE